MNLVSQPQESAGAGVVIPLKGGAAYRIGSRLGRAGEVYEAHHPRVEGLLALKLFRRATGVDAAIVDAFCRESESVGKLHHPHIAQVMEAGTMRDGTPFAALEHLDGQTLKERMMGRGTFSAAEVLSLVKGIAAALTAAHAAGLVHRELSPDSVFIANVAGHEHGFVKVLDFGACHLTAAQIGAGRNLAGRTSRYFAPEQLQGHSADAGPGADQFALAAIVRRMLNGTAASSTPVSQAAPGAPQPASGKGKGKNRKKNGKSEHETPLALRAPAVDAVVSKAMSVSPTDRFESVSLFLRAFEDALVGAGLIAAPTVATVSPVEQIVGAGRAVPAQLIPAPQSTSAATAVEAHPRYAVDPSSLSAKFFQEGDLQEATSFKDLPHIPEPKGRRSSPHLQFDSFDQIPTQRRSTVLVIAATVFGVAGVVWLTGVRSSDAWKWPRPELSETQAPVAAPAPAPASAPPSAKGPGENPTSTEPQGAVPAPLAPPARLAGEGEEGNAASTGATAAATAPGAPRVDAPGVESLAKDSADKAATDTTTADRKRARAIAPKTDIVRRRPPGPLYLWSPEKQAMVPASEINDSVR